jgi:4'-phosphopantetheinyl transferase
VHLARNTIHLFAAELHAAEGEGADFASLLSAEELAAANRRRGSLRRARYIRAHGHLRRVLGRCLDTEPRALQIRPGANGKPRLLGDGRWQSVHFNLSHCKDLVLIAVTLDVDVGIDVEEIRPSRDFLAMAKVWFTAAEAAALSSLDETQQCRAFYRCWTVKEAFVKATGAGIGDFQSFDVSLDAEAASKIALRRGRWQEDGHAWQVFAFEPRRDYVGAVVARGERIRTTWIVH